MELKWFLSAHSSTDKVILDRPRDNALDINTMHPITIKSNSKEEGFKKFIKSKEFNDFANGSFSKTLYWYYYDEQGCLNAYVASAEIDL